MLPEAFLLICLLGINFGQVVKDYVEHEGLYRTPDSYCALDLGLTNAPLVLHKNTAYVMYPLHNNDSIIHVPYKFALDFYCPGTTIAINGKDTNCFFLEAICYNGLNLTNQYKWSEISCTGPTKAVLLPHKGSSFQHNLFAVVFRKNFNLFANVFSISFDLLRSSVFYTEHKIHPVMLKPKRYREKVSRILYIDYALYFVKLQLNYTYSLEGQRRTINYLLGIPLSADSIISREAGRVLVPTFLTPSQDLFYESFQNATYRLANTVPVWKTVRTGNWAVIEDQVRYYSIVFNTLLRIRTGVHGTFYLYNRAKREVPIYLYVSDKIRKLPVPAILWKIVYDELHKKAIVLLTMNNPFRQNKQYIICKDVSANTGWLNWDTKREGLYGYSYACSLDDFKKTISGITFSATNGLLTWNR